MWIINLFKKNKKSIAREILILLGFAIISVLIYYSSIFIEERLNTYNKKVDIENVQFSIDSIKNLPKFNIIDEISCFPLRKINSNSNLETYVIKKSEEIKNDNESKPVFLSESDFIKFKKYGPDYVIQEKGQYWTIDPYVDEYIGTFRKTSYRRIANNYSEYISQKSFYDALFESSKVLRLSENDECLKRHLNLGILSFVDRNRLIDSLDIQENDNYLLKDKLKNYESKFNGLKNTIYKNDYINEIKFIIFIFIILYPVRILFFALKWALKNYK